VNEQRDSCWKLIEPKSPTLPRQVGTVGAISLLVKMKISRGGLGEPHRLFNTLHDCDRDHPSSRSSIGQPSNPLVCL